MQDSSPISLSDQILALSQQVTAPAQEDSRRQQLIDLIDRMIQQDFQSLVQLLYRVDVSEKKLKECLEKYRGMDTAPVLADLLIQRQLQKARTREVYSKRDPAGEEERW